MLPRTAIHRDCACLFAYQHGCDPGVGNLNATTLLPRASSALWGSAIEQSPLRRAWQTRRRMCVFAFEGMALPPPFVVRFQGLGLSEARLVALLRAQWHPAPIEAPPRWAATRRGALPARTAAATATAPSVLGPRRHRRPRRHHRPRRTAAAHIGRYTARRLPPPPPSPPSGLPALPPSAPLPSPSEPRPFPWTVRSRRGRAAARRGALPPAPCRVSATRAAGMTQSSPQTSDSLRLVGLDKAFGLREPTRAARALGVEGRPRIRTMRSRLSVHAAQACM